MYAIRSYYAVKGDLHDIGKNLVKMMFESKGIDCVVITSYSIHYTKLYDKRLDRPPQTCGVARVNDYRQMALAFDNGHGGDIQCVARRRFKRADAALAKYHVGIAARRNVFGRITSYNVCYTKLLRARGV